MGDDDTFPTLQYTAIIISIHVPRMGDDFHHTGKLTAPFVFLSTSPVWGTTCLTFGRGLTCIFLSTSPVWGTTANMTKKALELRQHLQQKDMVYKMISAFLYNLHLLARHFDTVLPLVSVRTGLWFAVCLVVALKLRKAIYRKCGDYTKWWLQLKVTPTAPRPAATAVCARCARPSFCTGCPAGKSAGCPPRGRSAPSVQP